MQRIWCKGAFQIIRIRVRARQGPYLEVQGSYKQATTVVMNPSAPEVELLGLYSGYKYSHGLVIATLDLQMEDDHRDPTILPMGTPRLKTSNFEAYNRASRTHNAMVLYSSQRATVCSTTYIKYASK